MNYISLAEKLVKAVVVNEDMVSVKEFPSDDSKKIIIEVLVGNDDMKRVIGKDGRTINAIRTVLAASSSLHDHKYIELNVEGF